MGNVQVTLAPHGLLSRVMEMRRWDLSVTERRIAA